MLKKRTILGINGSASENSSNLSIIQFIAKLGSSDFDMIIWDDLSELPHFKTTFTDKNTPSNIVEIQNLIKQSDAVIICTPEYIFSIPSGLKNMLEWSVSTTIFSEKPVAIITASASGEKGQEELTLIMQTLQAILTKETTLLIKGIKGKMNPNGEISDEKAKSDIEKLVKSIITMVES